MIHTATAFVSSLMAVSSLILFESGLVKELCTFDIFGHQTTFKSHLASVLQSHVLMFKLSRSFVAALTT